MYAKKYTRSVHFCIDDFVCFSDPIDDRRVDSEGIRSYLSSHIRLIPIGSQESSPVVVPTVIEYMYRRELIILMLPLKTQDLGVAYFHQKIEI